jgi:hypothetical protein
VMSFAASFAGPLVEVEPGWWQGTVRFVTPAGSKRSLVEVEAPDVAAAGVVLAGMVEEWVEGRRSGARFLDQLTAGLVERGGCRADAARSVRFWAAGGGSVSEKTRRIAGYAVAVLEEGLA